MNDYGGKFPGKASFQKFPFSCSKTGNFKIKVGISDIPNHTSITVCCVYCTLHVVWCWVRDVFVVGWSTFLLLVGANHYHYFLILLATYYPAERLAETGLLC